MPPKKPEETKVTKQFILDRLEENEVDLSMCGLTKVPVKELALVPRGTRLDLSRNHFTTLLDTFCTLRHLVQLDLSNNQLSQLPADFGQLSQLQRLDLYSNQLTTLPLSFSQLTKLKWLDLKNNPLDADLGKAAGLCLSERECKECAKKVLVYMKEKDSEAERRRQKKVAEQRARELRREAEKQAKREAARKERAEVRQRRRLEHEQREEAERRPQEEEGGEERDVVTETKLPPSTSSQTGCLRGCLWLSGTLLLVLFLALCLLYQTSWLEPMLTILAPPTGREGNS